MRAKTLGALAAALLAVTPTVRAATGFDDTKKVMSDLNRAVQAAMRAGTQTLPDDQAMVFVGRLYDLADEAEGGADAVEALNNVLTISAYYMKGETAGSVWCEAVERLIQEHLDDDALVQVVFSLNNAPAGMEQQRNAYLIEIAEETHSNAVKGAIAFLEAEKLLEEHDSGAPFTPHQAKELRRLLGLLQSDYKDVEDPYGRGTLGELAEGMQFAFEHLAVGKQAPDIEGEDLDGVGFKLSDYRGKVVLLDFWGHW